MGQYKYYIKGTLKGSRGYDNHTEDVESYELLEYVDEIRSILKTDEYDELAQYIHEDSILYGTVTEIWVDVKVINKDLYSWTEVTTTLKLTETEQEALLEYLSGQFSDGYGEGLEQHEFYSYTETETSEEYDEEEDEYYEDEYDVRVDMYLHLWHSGDTFRLELIEFPTDFSWLEIAKNDGDITEEESTFAKNIEFFINGEDYGLFLYQIKDFIPIKDIKSVSYGDIPKSAHFEGAYEVLLKNGQKKLFGWTGVSSGLEEILQIIKPKCKLSGKDGNIFSLVGIASDALKRVGLPDRAAEMRNAVYKAKDYSHALAIIADYVEVE